jgi:hypothetical protein
MSFSTSGHSQAMVQQTPSLLELFPAQLREGEGKSILIPFQSNKCKIMDDKMSEVE